MVEKDKVNVITMNMRNKEGGSYIRMNELVYGMSKKGWEVHHISPEGFRCENYENIIHHKIFYIPIPGRYIPYVIQTFFRMLYIVKKNKIDVMVAFGIWSSSMCIPVKIFSRHTKLCVSFRGDDIEGFKLEIKNKFLKFLFVKTFKILERMVLRKADLVIFLSNDLKERIMKRTKYNHIEKTKVIYNSIITSRLKRMAEDDGINFGTGKKIIGFVGGLYEEGKGLKYLIKAFYKVKQEVSNSMLVIVGDGPDKQKLISLAKNLNLEEDVIFTGFKENPVQYMKGFDLMVLPSLHEAFGAVILEALYVGTPVIGSRIGGIPEVLKYEELLFKPRNVDDLSSKIINLLKNNEVHRKAVDLCRERKGVFTFDWSNEMIKAIEDT